MLPKLTSAIYGVSGAVEPLDPVAGDGPGGIEPGNSAHRVKQICGHVFRSAVADGRAEGPAQDDAAVGRLYEHTAQRGPGHGVQVVRP